MNIKKNITRILLLALWIVLGSGVLVLLVAAINVKNHQVCNGINIEITGVKEYFFLTKQDIVKIISRGGQDEPEGKTLADFNLRGMESLLEKNIWVKDAELFFDNNLVLHVIIVEKEPVARIFTTGGNSFYIDSSGGRMPLSDKISIRIPVFTGFPVAKSRSRSMDSLLIRDIKMISLQILNDPFWMAQIAQVSITPDRTFEMIPTVGSHIIQFGTGENCAAKFNRLFIFYSQVLSRAGFDKYSRICVQYDRQVIGTRKGTITKIDSVQALKNILRMIEEARKVYEDSIYIPVESVALKARLDSVTRGRNLEPSDSVITVNTKPVAKAVVKKKPNVTLKEKTPSGIAGKKPIGKVNDRIPKAVMKRD